MEHFILLTRLISEEVHPSFSMKEKADVVKKQIATHCPTVIWTGNYATLGPWDYLDIFQASDTTTAMKVAMLVRSYGGAQTEIWPIIGWDDFKGAVDSLLTNVSGEKQYVGN